MWAPDPVGVAPLEMRLQSVLSPHAHGGRKATSASQNAASHQKQAGASISGLPASRTVRTSFCCLSQPELSCYGGPSSH